MDDASVPTLQAKLKTAERDLAIEEKVMQGAASLLRASKTGDQKKQAQKQLDGSTARVEQLRQTVNRVKDLLAAAEAQAAQAPPSTTPAQVRQSMRSDVYRRRLWLTALS